MWLVIVLVACDRDHTVAFPDGLAPLDQENQAAWPADGAEAVNTASGEADDYVWAHARGYIGAPLDAVYPCLRTTEVNLDRRQDAEWDRVDDVEEGYEHSYRLDVTVQSLVEVSFSDTWRHGSTRDEDDDSLLLVVTAWQMTEGNSYMTSKRGSIVTEPLDDETVSIDIVYQMDVALPDEEQMTTYLSDTHAELAACAAGEPLPTYDD